MNIADAKNIPLSSFVTHLGGRYSHTDSKGDMWYFSPFRPEEKTPSFKINAADTRWHDFGMSNTFAHQKQGSGGDIIDLWCDFNFKNRRFAVAEALMAIENLNLAPYDSKKIRHIQSDEKSTAEHQPPRYKIAEIANSITYMGLKDELNRRRISLKVADVHLKQGTILDIQKNKEYIGFLFENDKGGYEVSIPNPQKQKCFKTCIGPKASTRVLSGNDEINSADVFEGFWDFLSWLEMKKFQLPRNHSYILNSTSMVSQTCEKIIAFKETVKYVFLFMDNDEAGYQATHAIAEKLEYEGFQVGSLEYFYDGYKDLNEFWVSKPKLY